MSLFLFVILFALKSTFSDINIATPGFYLWMFVWYIFGMSLKIRFTPRSSWTILWSHFPELPPFCKFPSTFQLGSPPSWSSSQKSRVFFNAILPCISYDCVYIRSPMTTWQREKIKATWVHSTLLGSQPLWSERKVLLNSTAITVASRRPLS